MKMSSAGAALVPLLVVYGKAEGRRNSAEASPGGTQPARNSGLAAKTNRRAFIASCGQCAAMEASASSWRMEGARRFATAVAMHECLQVDLKNVFVLQYNICGCRTRVQVDRLIGYSPRILTDAANG